MVMDTPRQQLTSSRQKKYHREPFSLTFVVWFLFRWPYQKRLQPARECLSRCASVKVPFMVLRGKLFLARWDDSRKWPFQCYQLFKFDQKPVRGWKWSTMIAKEFWKAFTFSFWSGLMGEWGYSEASMSYDHALLMDGGVTTKTAGFNVEQVEVATQALTKHRRGFLNRFEKPFVLLSMLLSTQIDALKWIFWFQKPLFGFLSNQSKNFRDFKVLLTKSSYETSQGHVE